MPNNNCPDTFGCNGECVDFIIKRHDTKPQFIIKITDCGTPVDTTDCAVEASMWANAKLKKPLLTTDTHFSLADNIGFNQASVGDIIIADRIRNPELMLVKGFDENNNLIQVQRGYRNTLIGKYKRGTGLKIFRILNGFGSSAMVFDDIDQVDGTTKTDVLTETQLVYDWTSQDTCLPGCYKFEFRLIKLLSHSFSIADPISFSSLSTSGCGYAAGVDWMRRYPSDKEGFVINILDSPVSDSILI